MFKNYFEDRGGRKILRKGLYVFVILFLMVSSFGAGAYLVEKNDFVKKMAYVELEYSGKVLGKYKDPFRNRLSQDIEFDLFWEVWDTIKKEYVDNDALNEKEMFYGALRGLVDSVDDPYTIFMDPKTTKEFEDDLAGTFEGIGAEIGIRDDVLTIITPLQGAPAELAGLLPGDKVYAIDGESTADITVDGAVQKIRGPKGTSVVLTVSSDGMEATREVEIIRNTIIIKSVEWSFSDDIAIVKIMNFNDDTEGLFSMAVKEIITNNPKGVIIDLRNNPGGYLDTAIEVASEWVEDGVIVSEQFGDEEKNDFLARGRANLKDYKTVVLVNQGSASASEIVAGALQDHGRAIIVGKKTFGKGSVQTLESFSDGSSVKITVAKWLTPAGKYINEEGVTPDIEVDMLLEDYEKGEDPQMDKAIEIIKNK